MTPPPPYALAGLTPARSQMHTVVGDRTPERPARIQQSSPEKVFEALRADRVRRRSLSALSNDPACELDHRRPPHSAPPSWTDPDDRRHLAVTLPVMPLSGLAGRHTRALRLV